MQVPARQQLIERQLIINKPMQYARRIVLQERPENLTPDPVSYACPKGHEWDIEFENGTSNLRT